MSSLRLRGDLVDSLRKPEREHDERQPTRVSGFGFMGIFLQGGMPYKVVPEEFWSQDLNEEGYTAATVACPCGHAPSVELGAYPVKCECERWFFYTGTEVWALCSPPPDSGVAAA